MDDIIQLNRTSLIISASIIVVYFVLAHLIGVAHNQLIKKHRSSPKFSKTGTVFMAAARVGRFVLAVIAIALIMQVNGIRLTTLAAFLSIISAIIGLAIQDLLKDVVNGMHLVHDDYFAVGDTIIYQGHVGLVTEMSQRTVKLLDIDTKDTIVISNRNIDDIVRRSKLTDINLLLSYEDDHKKINQILREICDRIRDIPGIDDCVYKGVHDFRDHGVIYKIRFFCEPSVAPELRRAALRVIQDDLKAAGIRIPYPQLDIHPKEPAKIEIRQPADQ